MTTIASRAADCSTAFARLADSKSNQPDKQTEVENGLFRFRLWAHSNNALSYGRDSMDWALRRAPLPRSIILDLLEDLQQSVLAQLGSGELSKNTSRESPDALLDQLFRFSRAIHRAGGPQRLAKATHYVEIDENGTNLTATFRKNVEIYLHSILKPDDNFKVQNGHCITNSTLLDRLLQTICIRHQNFSSLKLRRKRKNRIVSSTTESKPVVPRSNSSPRVPPSVSISQNSQKQPVKQTPVRFTTRPSRPSSLSQAASTLPSNAQLDLEPQVEKPDSEFSFTELPRRPKIKSNQRDQECPYCLAIYPVEEFGQSKWPKHILQDLMPFICVLNSCPTPNAMYESRAAWIQHMRTEHTLYGWTCMDPSHKTSLHFTKEEDFVAHTKESHGEEEYEMEFDNQELKELVEDCYGPLPIPLFPDNCPFCGEHATSENDTRTLEDHVARHLLFLSQIGQESVSGIEYEMELGCSGSKETLAPGATNSLSAKAYIKAEIPDLEPGLDNYISEALSDDVQDVAGETGILSTDAKEDSRDIQGLPKESKEILKDCRENPSMYKFIGWTKIFEYLEDKKPTKYDPATDKVLESFRQVQIPSPVPITLSLPKIQTPNVVEEDSTTESSDTFSGSDSLSKILRDRMIKSAFDKTPHMFLPEGTLDQLITRQKVQDILGLQLAEGEKNALVEFILTRAVKLFAICVFIGLSRSTRKLLLKAMSLFQKHAISDDALPFDSVLSLEDAFAFDDNYSNPQPRRTSFFALDPKAKIWKPAWQWDFNRIQWSFLTPTFSVNIVNYDFDEGYIMPFVKKHAVVTRGAVSLIWNYEIHKNHLQDPLNMENKNQISYAVKEFIHLEAGDTQEVAQHWESEVRAMSKMNELNQAHIVRFITAFRRQKGDVAEHYMILEWASGGDLRNLWNEIPNPPLTVLLLKDVLKQLLGLATAIESAHNLDHSGASYRHGDLKPENIFRFIDSSGTIGTLKIGDWGEAKAHNVITELRNAATQMRYGTVRYEAPEVETGVTASILGQSTHRRSRLYDIWSLGCIYFEFLVWILYGQQGLSEFDRSLTQDSIRLSTFYEIISVGGGKKIAQVHQTVVKYMEHMAQDPACQKGTVLGDLLELIRHGLLVVKLPSRLGSSIVEINTGPKRPMDLNIPSITVTPNPSMDKEQIEIKEPQRLLATEFRNRLENMLIKGESETYWHTKSPRHRPPVTQNNRYTTSIKNQANDKSFETASSIGTLAQAIDRVDYAHIKLDWNTWKFQLNNQFASSLFSSLSSRGFRFPMATVLIYFCTNCSNFRNHLLDPGFSVSYTVADLESRAKAGGCEICRLLWRTCQRHGGVSHPTVKFDRNGSILNMNDGQQPVLSLFRTILSEDLGLDRIQIGSPELLESGSPTHLKMVREWLRDCDIMHSESTCRPALDLSAARVPERLIDVGDVEDTVVHLKLDLPMDAEWIALSHPWGTAPYFYVDRTNIEQFSAGIKIEALPPTFRDAVLVTRALGYRFLWIDALCIIQGADGDFVDWGTVSQDAFGGARCVINATCATNHYSGFLYPRNEPDYVCMPLGEHTDANVYMCQTVDNFQEHVLESELLSRAWVLEEHALARRTIFFTKYQTYFECGNGVQCETMTKMDNYHAKFLGDPNFPHILSQAGHGERILRYQNLYAHYSRLHLSKASDRPWAIDGLQKRLISAMGVLGGFGIFDERSTPGLLCRSLLWCRGSDTPALLRDEFPSKQRVMVPSWSWMAYSGGIDYLKLEFGGIEWRNIVSPWVHGEKNSALYADTCGYDLGNGGSEEALVILDHPAKSDSPATLQQHLETRCVVLGIQKGEISESYRRHYVLFVSQTPRLNHGGSRAFERFGVGYLPGAFIGTSTERVRIY